MYGEVMLKDHFVPDHEFDIDLELPEEITELCIRNTTNEIAALMFSSAKEITLYNVKGHK